MSLKVIQQIRDELIACAAVSSTAEFCRSWLAKDASYLRVLRHNQTAPSADAFAICASKLGYYAHQLAKSENTEHQLWAKRFVKLRSLCHQAMEQQSRAKWMTAERMGLTSCNRGKP
jgi:hypothetical protein